MAATSIHIKECIIEHSVKHNLRQITPNYVRTDLSHNNEKHIVVADLNQRLEEIKKLYKEKTNQKLHIKATPIREGVIVIDEHTTMEQLIAFGNSCKKKWGITPIQYFIHRDEGHYKNKEKKEGWKTNLHAHIVFDWQNKTTGKTCKLNSLDMKKMQDLLSKKLEMDRGIESDKHHLEHIQYKNMIEREKAQNIAVKIAQDEYRALKIEETIKEKEKYNKQLKQEIKNNELKLKEFGSLEQEIKKDKKAVQELQNSIEVLKEKETSLKMNVGYLSQEIEEIEEQKYKEEKRRNPSFVNELLELIEEIPVFGALFARNRDLSPMTAIKLALGKKVYINGEKTYLDEEGNRQTEKREKFNPFIHNKKKKGLGF